MKDTDREMRWYDKMACKYIKKIGLDDIQEQIFYDDLACFLNIWREHEGYKGIYYEFKKEGLE